MEEEDKKHVCPHCGGHEHKPEKRSEEHECCGHGHGHKHEHEDSCCCGHSHEAEHDCCGSEHHHGGGCCCHSGGSEHQHGCCSDGEIPHHGLKLWIAAASILASFIAGEFCEYVPFYPLTDPAWIAVILCGLPIFSEARRSFFGEGKITSALLVSVAMLGAFALQAADFAGYSESAGHSHGSYIFVVAEIAFLMSLGEWLEERTVRKSRSGIESLAKLLPKTAVVKIDGKETEIPADQVKKGQILCVKAHSVFPADARVISGSSSADESAITGESVPVEKAAGDVVYAGTTNLTGYLELEAVKDASNSEMSKLAKLVEEASGQKAPIARTADKWASMVIPSAIALAVIVFFVSHFLLATPWIESAIRGVTILVVFCPCAFVLATPTAIAAGLGNAAKRGILIKSGEALEILAGVRRVFFDKTGTLTEAKMRVEKFEVADWADKSQVAALAAGAEMRSEHPIGRAVFDFASAIAPAQTPDSTKSLVGAGIEAVFGGKTVSLGKPDNAAAEKFKEGGLTAVSMKIDGRECAIFGLSDTVRRSAKTAVQTLSSMGIDSAIISGDNRAAAEKIAAETSIKKVYAPVLPARKLEIIAEAQAAGDKVCMVGDGVNDAPALAKADSSMAIASLKNDIAIESAQISVAGGDLTAVPYAIGLSKSTLRTIKANILFSITVNLTAVVLAFFGLINPVAGALIHNMSSVCVVMNSSRLLRYKK